MAIMALSHIPVQFVGIVIGCFASVVGSQVRMFLQRFLLRTCEPKTTLELSLTSVLLNPKFAMEDAAKTGELRIQDTSQTRNRRRSWA